MNPKNPQPANIKKVVYIPTASYKAGNTSPTIKAHTQFIAVANPKAFSLFNISALYTQAKGPIERLNTILYKKIRDMIIIEFYNETFS